MKVSKERLDILKKFMEQEYYHADSDTQRLIILHLIKSSANLSWPSINLNNDVQIIYDINVYKDARPSDLDRIVAKYSNLWIETGRVVNVPKKY